MSKFKFTKEIFKTKLSNRPSEIATELAQKALDEYLEKCTVVYGNLYPPNNKYEAKLDIGSIWNTSKLNDKTHRAVLFNIEPVEEDKKCEHKEVQYRTTSMVVSSSEAGYYCLDCNKKVQPTKWEVSET